MRNMNGPARNGTLGTGALDLDEINEFIVESGFKLPGPPPPPSLTPTEISNGPVLVSRCTDSPQRPNLFPQVPSAGTRNMSSLPSSRGPKAQAQRRGTPVGRSARSHQTGTEQLERLLNKPQLQVVEQPKERGMRFRYECEGRSAGSILGASSTEVNKTLPAIEIQGPIEGIKKVTVTVSLVTKDIPYRPHPHCLVGKDCSDGICIISLNPHTTRRHSFVNLGIQCVRRKELDASLIKRRNKNIDPFNTGQSKSIEDMDMNVVRLCFQCELELEDGDRIQLSPVVSNPIYDKKATTTAELKINRLNIVRGPCSGKTEIYMLCDKVQKDDIEIIFHHDDWEAKAEFAQTDVHRQIAIVFKAPPYQEQDISEEVEVNVCLRRISDRMHSDPVKFTYVPLDQDPYEVDRKRKIKSDIKFSEDCRGTSAPDRIINKPATSHQIDTFNFIPFDCGIPLATPLQDFLGTSSQPSLGQGLEDLYADPFGQEDSCVSLDPDAMGNLLVSISECIGQQNLFQLFNNADPGFDGSDPNLNIDMGQPQMNLSSYSDMHFNQMVSDRNHGTDPESLPQDLIGISLGQVKTENEGDS
ncbi:transcription factor RelB isoform X1 [Astyanax mexicanus]|uniref:transcription factor RelB isoform X1 n=2 Tax=Astyanax mexicanus TaxID=7994 RepID=UPI0020CB52AB|nr:transcription factor RelB isoform X1 [Astyanax mexicanus]